LLITPFAYFFAKANVKVSELAPLARPDEQNGRAEYEKAK